MAGKEGIMIIFNMNKSMGSQYNESMTKLDFAKECIHHLIRQKDQIGLIALGGNQSDNNNGNDLLYLSKLDYPTSEVLILLNDVIPNDNDEDESGKDLFEAMSFSIKEFIKKYKKLKWIKKIFLITDGDFKCKATPQKLESLANDLEDNNINTNIIAIDFFQEADNDINNNEDNMQVDEEQDLTENQKKTKEAIKLLQSHTKKVKVFTAESASNIYHQFRKKKINPTTKFRGPLIMTPDVSLDVAIYTKTYTQTLPSLKKYSLVSEYTDDPKGNGIINERLYYIHDDPERIPISNSLITKAYYYGNSLVPVTKEDEVRFKNNECKCLKTIGFTDSFRIPRHYFMSGVDLVIPNPDGKQGDCEAFLALVTEMIKIKKVLLARYIFRQNADPKLVCLTPYLSKKGPLFYLNILPTVEDIREYQFESLKESTLYQEKLVSNFIDSLDLDAKEEKEDGSEEQEENLKPNNTYNPILQYFYQCLESKAIEDNKEIPNLDDSIAKYLIPSKKLFENNKYVAFFPKLFEIKEKEKKNEKKKRVFWKEVIENEMNTALTEKKLEEKLNANKEEGKKTISTITPVEDFINMIQNRTEDLAIKAINLMKDMIERFILDSFKGSYYIRAIECIKALRIAANEEDEVENFNTFLQDMRSKFPKEKFLDFWLLFTDNNITMISIDENPKSSFSDKECQEWLNSMRKKEVITSTIQDIDNLLLDID